MHPTALHLLDLSLLLFLFSLGIPFTVSSSASLRHLLRRKGLPGGLFPDSVKRYSVGEGGRLEVELLGPCMAKFENRVYFEMRIEGNLSNGKLNGLVGLSQEELFLWLPVKDIIVIDPSSGLILFDIGLALKQISLSLFEDPPVCHPQGNILEEKAEMKKKKEEEKELKGYPMLSSETPQLF